MNDDHSQAEIIEQNRNAFLSKVRDVLESHIEEGKDALENPKHDPEDLLEEAVRGTAAGILRTIDGSDGDLGYFLIPKEEDLAMLPASQGLWDETNRDREYKTGLDIAHHQSLVQSLFDDINS